jgi:hypothetical protein
MSAEVELISTMGEKKLANRPPIQMEFQVTIVKNLFVTLSRWLLAFLYSTLFTCSVFVDSKG